MAVICSFLTCDTDRKKGRGNIDIVQLRLVSPCRDTVFDPLPPSFRSRARPILWGTTGFDITTEIDELTNCCVKLQRQVFLNFSEELWR